MRITIASVGRFKTGPERALFDHYRGRVAGQVSLREVEVKGRYAAAALIEREAALLDPACPAGAYRIALDPAGTSLSSEEFARHLAACREDGVGDIAFLIGGAEGLSAELIAGARLRLAFGPATWPHLLVRAMLMEQIYRAQQIHAGHPYHRGGKPV